MSLAGAQDCCPSSWLKKPPTSPTPARNFRILFGGGSTKGNPKGKGGAGAPCYYCGELGHIAKDCKKKKADIEAGIITPQPKGKGRQGQARAKFVVKAAGGDDA